MADADKMDVDTQPAPSTEAAAAQSQLGLRIQKYFAQLSTGCGGPCSQPFCGSNPGMTISYRQLYTVSHSLRSQRALVG